MEDETETRVVVVALSEHHERLEASRRRAERIRVFLEEEAWPQMPDGERGKALSKAEREAILGYGPEGV